MSHPQDSDPRLLRLPPLFAGGRGRWMLHLNLPGECPHGEALCDAGCAGFSGCKLERPLDFTALAVGASTP